MCHGSHNVIKSNYMHNLGIGPYNFKMLDIRNSELKFEDPLEGSVSLSYLTMMFQDYPVSTCSHLKMFNRQTLDFSLFFAQNFSKLSFLNV